MVAIFNQGTHLGNNMISNQLILDRLAKLYDHIMLSSNSPKVFYLELYKIIEIYDINSHFEPLAKLIIEKQANDCFLLYILEAQVKKELNEAYEKIKAFVDSCHFTNVLIAEQLSSFEFSINLPRESGLFFVPSLYGKLKYILIQLSKNMYPDLGFLEQFATFNEKSEIEHFTFIPSLEGWQQEEDKIYNTQEAKVWYAYYKLVEFYKDHNPSKYEKNNRCEIDQYKGYLEILYNFTKQNFSLLNQRIR